MSKIKLSYITENIEEHKNLEEALGFFRDYFMFDINKEDQILFVTPTRAMVKTFDEPRTLIDLENTKGVLIYPEREAVIKNIHKNAPNQSEKKYPVFWFDSSSELLTIGLQKAEDKRYLFEVYYKRPDFIK